MSKIQKISSMLLVTACMVMMTEAGAFAAKSGPPRPQSFSMQSENHSARQEMMMDLSMHYVRDTNSDGGTDSAARFSIGGMFNEWMGLDVQGLYEVRSKSYLVGANFRFLPVDWFFLKGGAGGYSQKVTNQLALTPLAGAGILARLSRDYYFVTEGSYFTVNERNNISFGVGLGTSF